MASSAASRAITMGALVFAGEAVFSLPFHVARFFRPTMLAVFGLDNAGLGDIFAVYGVAAMLAYFPGGVVADRFSPRKLMALSLWLTAAGGVLLALAPSAALLRGVYAWWGVTTVLLFWAAMIRATAGWGGEVSQGRAFGLLDGGRGLAAAGLATVAVLVLRHLAGADPAAMNPAARSRAFFTIVAFYATMTTLAGLACWRLVPDLPTPEGPRLPVFRSMGAVLRRPAVWMQAVIVVAAYCGYKSVDNVGLYARDVLGRNEVEAAAFVTACAWLRVPSAIVAGLVADRFRARSVLVGVFALLALVYGVVGVVTPARGPAVAVVVGSIVVTFAAVYALRGVYFALLKETAVPAEVTGTAVGFISVVGFTPDIFFASLTGRILDAAPGLVGHQRVFSLLSGVALVGAAVALGLSPHDRQRPSERG